MFVNFEVLRLNFVHLFQVFQDTEPLDKNDIEKNSERMGKAFSQS